WLSNDSVLNKKEAFLRAIWLSVSADLYAKKMLPAELRWSYPSSMSNFDVNQYRNIFNKFVQLTPVKNKETGTQIQFNVLEPQTESEAVCKYALSQQYGLDRTLFVGIDIGGSTSDILLLTKDPLDIKRNPRLFKQSSVRMAAGIF
ncbi:hypothetical protein RZS08_24730, partial [Arthrospira platensis SPKY1]|nr:hypothetical protein [Arthrospira platensis SPKY1]